LAVIFPYFQEADVMNQDDNLFEPWEIKTRRRRRKRRPTLASVTTQALKAGATKATLAPDGTVSLEFSKPGVEPTPANPWDEVLEHGLPH
jgi:hypothetical protein